VFDLTCKHGSVARSEGLSFPRSSVPFRLKPENSNSHGFELHRPSIKGTKLLLKVIKAKIIMCVCVLCVCAGPLFLTILTSTPSNQVCAAVSRYSSCAIITELCLCMCQCAYICAHETIFFKVMNMNKYKQNRDDATCNIKVEIEIDVHSDKTNTCNYMHTCVAST